MLISACKKTFKYLICNVLLLISCLNLPGFLLGSFTENTDIQDVKQMRFGYLW